MRKILSVFIQLFSWRVTVVLPHLRLAAGKNLTFFTVELNLFRNNQIKLFWIN